MSLEEESGHDYKSSMGRANLLPTQTRLSIVQTVLSFPGCCQIHHRPNFFLLINDALSQSKSDLVHHSTTTKTPPKRLSVGVSVFQVSIFHNAYREPFTTLHA